MSLCLNQFRHSLVKSDTCILVSLQNPQGDCTRDLVSPFQRTEIQAGMGSKEGVVSGIVIIGHQEADLFAGSPGADMLRAVGKDFHPAGSGA